jgi:hypothetical protein
MIKPARNIHSQRIPITKAHQKLLKPHGYSRTRLRITLTHQASRSRIALTVHVNDKARTSDTQNVGTLHTRIKSSTQHMRIRKHAVESRSRITFTHVVHESRLRSTLIRKFARQTLTTYARYTRASEAPHTTRIFAHTPTDHAHASLISFKYRTYAPR